MTIYKVNHENLFYFPVTFGINTSHLLSFVGSKDSIFKNLTTYLPNKTPGEWIREIIKKSRGTFGNLRIKYYDAKRTVNNLTEYEINDDIVFLEGFIKGQLVNGADCKTKIGPEADIGMLETDWEATLGIIEARLLFGREFELTTPLWTTKLELKTEMNNVISTSCNSLSFKELLKGMIEKSRNLRENSKIKLLEIRRDYIQCEN